MKMTTMTRWALLPAFALLAVACGDESNPVLEPSDPSAATGTNAGWDLNDPLSGEMDVNGALWQWPVPFNVGTGQINPFLSVQANGVEEGFNSLVKSLDGKRYTNFTNDLSLNHVPTIYEGEPLVPYREIILDANEANSGADALFAIQIFDLWLCDDSDAPQYDALSDFEGNGACALVYGLGGETAYATDEVTSGSGLDLDYRILIPEQRFRDAAEVIAGSPAGAIELLTGCHYQGAEAPPCGAYLVLHAKFGGEEGWITGSTFEEMSTILRPVPPYLTLTKQVINNNGGTAVDTDWTLSANGPLNISGVEGDAAITAAAVVAGVYTLGESGGPSGYSTTGVWVCTGDGTFTSPNQIELADGETASCEITNTDDPPYLTLTKQVINNNGGTAVDTDWTLSASGPMNISGAEGDATITSAEVLIGEYTLSESAGPAGYSSNGVWSCTGGTFTSPDKISLALGESASCEITNTDDPATLTLTKLVINNNGGTAVDTDWTLSAAGPDNISGVEGAATVTNAPVAAGQYTLSESAGPAGYSSDGVWSCTGGTFTSPDKITVALGESASCEITNTDDPPYLTLTKLVVNDNGGTAVDTDWTLYAAGPVNISGVEGDATITNAEVSVGTYNLSESAGPAGYSSDGVWSCTGGTFTSPNQIALALGESASCEITNTDDPPYLTLTKLVINDDGGTAVDTDWTLYAAGPVNISGVEGDATITNAEVSVGTYNLSESAGPAGYSSDGVWSCTGGTFTSPNQIALALGESASCEITNDDVPMDTETAWAANGSGETAVGTLPYPGSNWATYVEYAVKVVDLFAGQDEDAGDVTFSAVSGGNITITIELVGWTFAAGSMVKIQDYSSAPTESNPSPGQFDHTCTPTNATQATCVVPANNYYGVHAVVQ